MSNRPRMKRSASPRRARVLAREQLANWLASLDPPAAGLSMIDGYLAALVVSPRFIPPDNWLKPILGERVTWADEGTIQAAARNTLFQRYNEIGATLSGGPRRYAPLFMRTDEGAVLIEDFADGLYVGMQLSLDDWKPFFAQPEIGIAMTAILGHCTAMLGDQKRGALPTPQAEELLARSWEVVPELMEMLHVKLAGSQNVEIR